MDQILIEGGRRLNGTIPISGAKNATLPLMIASLLTEGELTLTGVPHLADVTMLSRILRHLGSDITIAGLKAGEDANAGETMTLKLGEIANTHAPYEFVRRMRASFWVLGPLLARAGHARVSLPGGCAIGTRPVDLYLAALRDLGGNIEIESGDVIASAPDGLRGARITFPKVTVGATHTALMAAVLAKGETVIENAAREPEIEDVARCLVAMGARIEGAGTSTIRVQGVEALGSATHPVLPDRIESGTYAMAVGMVGGEVLLKGARADLIEVPIDILRGAGVDVAVTNEGIRVARNGAALAPVEIETSPFPGFPTDLQAQLMALMTRADGTTTIRETIFENRFMHVGELARLGADISLAGDVATVRGVSGLKGAPVMATDLRASVSLVIAGLAAEGETVINRVYHLDRGFERLEEKLEACGARIRRVSE
jgi:UDP-N-acetylglucosamine 1-carboxyvinyltransferase